MKYIKEILEVPMKVIIVYDALEKKSRNQAIKDLYDICDSSVCGLDSTTKFAARPFDKKNIKVISKK